MELKIKVKCSDTKSYYANPVYTFIEAGEKKSFDIIRLNNKTRDIDKIIFVTAFVSFSFLKLSFYCESNQQSC